jgi:transcriptional regulator with XRE-family HTH domain
MDKNATPLEAAISMQVKVELLERSMDQKDLADAVGIERATLSRYMTGRRPMPMAVFFDIAEVLDVRPRELMARAEARLDRQGSRTA